MKFSCPLGCSTQQQIVFRVDPKGLSAECGCGNTWTPDLDSENGQACPDCGDRLYATQDNIGGGSHYWTMTCRKCSSKFLYDTYRFKLRYYTSLREVPDHKRPQ